MPEFAKTSVVPVISALVYIVITLYKIAVKEKEPFMRVIPIIAAVLGMALGITAFYAMPEIMPASDPFSALLIGAVSGLAATGVNQIYKQATKDKTDGGDGDGKNKADKPDSTEKESSNTVIKLKNGKL